MTRRPARLHAVPAERHLRLVEPTAFDDRTVTAIVKAVREEPADLHEATCDEDGITVTNCVACMGRHFTRWDRVVIGVERRWRTGEEVYVAWWPCPNEAGQALRHTIDEIDLADAVESGADLMESAQYAYEFARIVAGYRHPSSQGPVRPGGGDVA
jgi:hypothetical protein